MQQAWRAASAKGAGVTVAVLSTGVSASQQDLSGAVLTGPDYAGSGRVAGGPFWGFEGTAVAGLIAGHGHGAGGASGSTGIAPRARILSVPVTLEYDDPLNSDAAITKRLPDAIAAGIRYAVAHGARVIALPLDPGTLGLAAGDPAAAGGSAAERSAVAYAVAHDVVLVAPAGDNGMGAGTVNYPAAYPGVLAVGATAKGGQLAPFTNKSSYVALTAPGAGLTLAAPGGDGYGTLASTDMSAALAAGVAALIRSRFPGLTAAAVVQAMERGVTGRAASGGGHGALDAAGAVTVAATLAARQAPPATATPSPQPSVTQTAAAWRHVQRGAVRRGNPGRLAAAGRGDSARRADRGPRGRARAAQQPAPPGGGGCPPAARRRAGRHPRQAAPGSAPGRACRRPAATRRPVGQAPPPGQRRPASRPAAASRLARQPEPRPAREAGRDRATAVGTRQPAGHPAAGCCR